MATYLLEHRHQPTDCAVAFAAWKGVESPLRDETVLSSCPIGEHRLWFVVEAPDETVALSRLPRYLAEHARSPPRSPRCRFRDDLRGLDLLPVLSAETRPNRPIVADRTASAGPVLPRTQGRVRDLHDAGPADPQSISSVWMSTAEGDSTMNDRPPATRSRAGPSQADAILHFINSAISDEPPLDELGTNVEGPEALCTRPARGRR